ncbi:MAG: zinc ribbon domain-containing protein [Firmicutes bacterium HGW-Firmicutes-14]|nr:MAG: zinc ribbon domain-containing protein [Firmicutes bacterium HGW-Firmicutes-14]
MPAYDFKCKTCEHKFSVRISINERDQVKCPECGSPSVQQLFTPFSVSVKGEKNTCDLGCGASTRFG